MANGSIYVVGILRRYLGTSWRTILGYLSTISDPSNLANGASCHAMRFYATADALLALGAQVRIKNNGKMAAAQGNSITTMPVVATVEVGGAAEAQITCAGNGVFVRNNAWAAMTPGDIVFQDPDTLGGITTAPTWNEGDYVQPVGVVYAAQIVLFGNFTFGAYLP